MASKVAFDLKALRTDDVVAARHLLELRTEFPESVITEQLLDAVAQESVPPIVFAPFSTMIASASCLKTIVLQGISKYAQQYAVKALGKKLGKPEWKRAWDDIGGVGGLVEMMAELSVYNVKTLVGFIGLGYRQNRRDASRQKAVTALFYALCSSTPISTRLPEPVLRNTDQRPLLELYLSLLPSCSDQCVRQLLDMEFELHDSIQVHKLLVSHTLLMQQLGREGYLMKLEGLSALLNNVPNGPGDEPSFTASMTYTLSLIEAGIKSKSVSGTQASGSWGVPRLAMHLIRLAYKKRVPYARMAELIRMTINHFASLPKQQWKAHTQELLELTTMCWAGRRSRFTQYGGISPRRVEFGDLLQKMLFYTRPSEPLVNVDNARYLNLVERPHRYTLLRMQVQAHASVDIEDKRQVSLWQLNRLDSVILHIMVKDEAATFLERLLEVRPHANFLKLPYELSSVLSSPNPDAREFDARLLLARLQDDKRTSEVLILDQLEKQKEKAATTREADKRANQAKSVLWMAVKSSSLLIFEETVLWLRRFIRDPLTVKEVFSGSTIDVSAVVDLLAAVPSVNDFVAADKIESDVGLANGIFHALIDIMKDSMREPSFPDDSWRTALYVIGRTASKRIDRFTELENEGKMTFREIEDVIWSSTQDLLLDFEKITLDPAYKILRMDGERGPLSTGIGWGHVRIRKTLSKSCLKAMDRWATLRNELWQRHRRLCDPNTALVKEPFTQGLPLQFLLSGIDAGAGWNAEDTPYVFTRAEEVVFIKPELAREPVPSSSEMRQAIKNFVDFPGDAVEVFIFGGDRSLKDVQGRFQKFWSHWVGMLESDGMTRPLAERFLRDNFSYLRGSLPREKYLPILEFLEGSTDEPWIVTLPDNSDSTESNEWEPLSEQIQSESFIRAPTVLDCFLTITSDAFSETPFAVPPERNVTIPGRQFFQDILLVKAGQLRKQGVSDAVIAVSLLYLDAKKGRGERLLSSPFPSAADPRFPSLYLEESILEHATINQALENLRKPLRDIPAGLLLALTTSYLETLSKLPKNSSDIAWIESTSFLLLKLLAESDRPEKAFDLVTSIILDRPDASSWHRQLLGNGFMQRLSVKQVDAFLSNLVGKVVARLRGRAEQIKPSSSEPQRKRPHVKVTTIKQIAQMLRGSKYIPVQTTIDIMSELLTNSYHRDVRIEVVETLLDILPKPLTEGDSSGDDIAHAVIATLSMIVPSMAALPISEDAWKRFETDGVIPKVLLDLKSQAGDVLRHIILSKSSTIPQRYRTAFVQQIVIPSMTVSIACRTRGLQLLLRKYNLDTKIADVMIPFNIDIFVTILRTYKDELSSTYLDVYHRWIMFIIKETAEVKAMHNFFKQSKTQDLMHVGKFLQAAIPSNSWMDNHNHFYYSELLNTPWSGSLPGDGRGFSIEKVQNLFLEQLSAIVAQPYVLNAAWAGLISRFEGVLVTRSINKLVGNFREDLFEVQWQRIARPMLGQCIAAIDKKRTVEWQRDPNRQPTTLPSTFKLRTCLLPHAYLFDTPGDKINIDKDTVNASLVSAPQTPYSNMANAVSQLLEDTVNASSYQTSFEDLKLIQRATQAWDNPSRLRMACILGCPPSLTVDGQWTNPSLKPTSLPPLDMYRTHIAHGIFEIMATQKGSNFMEKVAEVDFATKRSLEARVGRQAKIEWNKIYANEVTVQVLDVMNVWMGSAVEELRRHATSNLKSWGVNIS